MPIKSSQVSRGERLWAMLCGRSLALDQLDCMPIRITYQCAPRAPKSPIGDSADIGPNERGPCRPEPARHLSGVAGHECGLPVHEVVGALVGGHGVAVPRRQVLEELDAWPGARPDRGDAEARSEDRVQVLLLRAVVLAPPG